MSGPKRNPDKLNTIGVVVVGICGAVLVYVTIVALQAFYMNDTSEIQTMADYGGNDNSAKSIKATALGNIASVGTNPTAAPKPGEQAKPPTYHMNIDDAMKLVVENAKVDPSTLIPSQGRSDKATIKPIPGRPQPLTAPAPAPTPAPTEGAGAGSAAAPTGTTATPESATGGLGQGGGSPQPKTEGGAGSAAPTGAAPPPVTPVAPPAAPKGNAP